MKKKNALLTYWPVFLAVLCPLLLNKMTGTERELVMVVCIAVAVAFNTSKLLKFYKEANKTINVIWVSAILLMIAGGVIYYFFQQQIGLGISAVGIVAFGYTWHYSFLENRPDIQ